MVDYKRFRIFGYRRLWDVSSLEVIIEVYGEVVSEEVEGEIREGWRGDFGGECLYLKFLFFGLI